LNLIIIFSSESESQSIVEPSGSDTKFGGKPGSEDSKSWLNGNNSDFTASSKQFLQSSSSLGEMGNIVFFSAYQVDLEFFRPSGQIV